MKDENFKIFIEYLKIHLKGLFVAALFSIVFCTVFYLHNLPLEAVAYAFAICLFLGIILFLADFLPYYKKIVLLRRMKGSITVSLEELPEPRGLVAKEYTELLEIIHKDKITKITDFDNKNSEIMDYFTLWAHQIKTPIAAIRLLLQSEEEQNNSFQDISMELFKIEQYVEMVLQYIRLGSSSTDYVFKEYTLDSIVRQAVRKYAKLFIHKKIKLDFKSLDCNILTDEKWLVFVIEQLLSNSLKYTDKGEIRIYMDEGYNKTLIIEDTGIGIKGDDLPRVFENGFTGYNGRRDKKSTGIGLYLCKRILNRLSHTISIESVPGRGTRVKICFDVVRVQSE